MSDNKFKLLRLASNASTLQEICQIAFELLGNPIFIEDRSSVKLAFTKNVKVDDPNWEADIVKGTKKPSMQNEMINEMKQNYKHSGENRMPVIADDNYMPYPRIIKAMYIHGMHVATLVCVGYFKPFSDEDIEIVEVLSNFIIIHFESEKYHLTTSEFAIDNFIIRLLNGEIFSKEAIREHIKILNWSSKSYNYVFDIFVASDHLSDEAELDYDLDRILEDFRSVPSSYAVIYDNHLVCISRTESKYPLSSGEEWPFDALLTKYHMRAGISAPLKNLSQLFTGYKQAQSMSNIASVLQNDGITYYPYDEFAFYHMMEVAEQRQGLREFCHQKILDLEAYDTEHNTDLVPTLHVYLESYRSISHTAEVMFIHRNTVSYRINKCFELLGTRIESGSELFSFTFSLRILEYYNKKKGKMPPF
ncbi:MAG: helix-turn-helix domain-containing protein [Eubacterium sp.]|nr:helix-turn-helix domain-containing protein [Eubacterium sp.]